MHRGQLPIRFKMSRSKQAARLTILNWLTTLADHAQLGPCRWELPISKMSQNRAARLTSHKSQLRLTALADQRNGIPEALPQDLVIRGQLQARLERMGLSAAAGRARQG